MGQGYVAVQQRRPVANDVIDEDWTLPARPLAFARRWRPASFGTRGLWHARGDVQSPGPGRRDGPVRTARHPHDHPTVKLFGTGHATQPRVGQPP
jgi:hypothetical protein